MSKKILAFTFSALLLGGCYPLPLYMQKPDGPPEYQQGYWDGCESGMASIADSYYHKIFFRFTKDPHMMDNHLYGTGWNEGFGFCRFWGMTNK